MRPRLACLNHLASPVSIYKMLNILILFVLKRINLAVLVHVEQPFYAGTKEMPAMAIIEYASDFLSLSLPRL